jgi:hypothetical protein
MRQIIITIIYLTIHVNSTFSQTSNCAEKENYHLTQAGKCFDSIFIENNVNKEKFKTSFEQYFIESKLVDPNLKKSELYMQILKALEENSNWLPPVKEAEYVAYTAGQLKITIPQLEKYEHLNCIKNETD